MCDKTKHLAPRIAPSLEFVEPSKALVCTLTVYASDMQLARFESSLGTVEEISKLMTAVLSQLK